MPSQVHRCAVEGCSKVAVTFSVVKPRVVLPTCSTHTVNYRCKPAVGSHLTPKGDQ